MSLERYKYLFFSSIMLALVGCDSSSSAANPSSNAAAQSCSLGAHLAAPHAGPYLPLPRTAANVSYKALQSHIPNGVRTLADQGSLDSAQTLSITVALNLNNESDLDSKLASMYQPGSADYHHYMTPEEFRARYAPTDDQLNQVRSYLVAHGLTPLSVNDNKMLITAQGSTSAINSAFNTELHNYVSSHGASYYAPAYELQIPSSLPIQACTASIISATGIRIR